MLVACFLLLSSLGFADVGGQSYHINTEQLRTWYNQNVKMIIIDARSQRAYSGKVLPGSKWISHDSSDAVIQEALPSKNALIIVYCGTPSCPASSKLVEKLKSLGYTNVYEYQNGLQDWLQKGLPTENAPSPKSS